jgi:DNA-directed RNA polymerase subunit RPC12/RpoP
MALKITRCARCSGARELKTLPSVSAENGPLKLTLLEMPVFACAKGHKGPVHSEFMLWVIHEIRAREAQIPAGKEEGMIFKKHRCGDCGKDLSSQPERRHVYPYDLKYEDLAPFKLQIEMPLYKCTACGKEQLRSIKDLHGHAAQAIVGINDGAGFPHSG